MFSEEPKLKEQRLVEKEATTVEDIDRTVEIRSDQSESSDVSERSDRSDRSDAAPFGTSNAEDSLIGKTIGGHYLILSRLGSGGMSVVYAAKHLLLDKTVAIKIISAGHAIDGKALMRFQQEAKASTALNHQNIAAVSEFGQDKDGSPFLVMEYVKGKSLSEIIREEGKLTQERSVVILLQLCDALHYAHEKQVIHRDIKPANIIITTDSSGSEMAKIVDFGIAKILSKDGTDLTQTGETFGTPSYMSPEQCHGKSVDRRSDIYSLGCVFEEMLSGSPPFVAESSLETLMMHVNETPTVRHSSAVNQVILRALEKQPGDRFQTANEMAAAVRALSQDNRILVQSQVPSRRREAMGFMVAGFVTAIVLSVVTYFFAIEKDQTKQMAIACAGVLYIGGLINLLVSHLVKKHKKL